MSLLETNLAVIFEPVAGNAGTHMLCTGLVQLESEKENIRSFNRCNNSVRNGEYVIICSATFSTTFCRIINHVVKGFVGNVEYDS